MKQNQQCPKCGGQEIFHSPYVPDRGPQAPGGMVEMYVTMLPREKRGWWEAHGYEPRGKVEAYVCLNCGYIELYTPDHEFLRAWGREQRLKQEEAHIPAGAISRAPQPGVVPDGRSLSRVKRETEEEE